MSTHRHSASTWHRTYGEIMMWPRPCEWTVEEQRFLGTLVRTLDRLIACMNVPVPGEHEFTPDLKQLEILLEEFLVFFSQFFRGLGLDTHVTVRGDEELILAEQFFFGQHQYTCPLEGAD